jgi:hypothetical protein
MKTSTFIAGIAALLLATGTAHAEIPAGKARECPVKYSPENKVINDAELKECTLHFYKKFKITPGSGYWTWKFPPPPEYDFPYEGVLMVQQLKIEDVRKVCAEQRAANGCALVLSNLPGRWWTVDLYQTGNRAACVIVIPTDSFLRESHQKREDIIRHETGHCNGWPGDHPNSQSKWEWVEK